VVSAEINEAGFAEGVRLDGPFPDHETAEAEVNRHRSRP